MVRTKIDVSDYKPARKAYESSEFVGKISYEEYVEKILSGTVRRVNLRMQNLCQIID
jgi:hypothetical protein